MLTPRASQRPFAVGRRGPAGGPKPVSLPPGQTHVFSQACCHFRPFCTHCCVPETLTLGHFWYKKRGRRWPKSVFSASAPQALQTLGHPFGVSCTSVTGRLVVLNVQAASLVVFSQHNTPQWEKGVQTLSSHGHRPLLCIVHRMRFEVNQFHGCSMHDSYIKGAAQLSIEAMRRPHRLHCSHGVCRPCPCVSMHKLNHYWMISSNC